MKKLQHSQFFRYVLTGGMTTGINYVIFLFLTTCSCNYLIANSLAWIGAVIFAFFANRHVVFRSDGNWRQEFYKFFSVRFLTLVLENLLLVMTVEWMGMVELFAKITVSVVTVTLNFIACKYSIFHKGA